MKAKLHVKPLKLRLPGWAFLPLLAMAIPLCFVGGVFYQFGQYLLPMAILALVAPLLNAAVCGGIAGGVVRAGKCLRPSIAALTGALLGATSLYAGWLTAALVYLDESWLAPDLLAVLPLDPLVLYELAREIAVAGVYHVDDAPLGELEQLMLWCVEIFVMLSVPATIASKEAYSGAVCSKCKQWMFKTEHVLGGSVMALQTSSMAQRVAAVVDLPDPQQYKADYLLAEKWNCTVCSDTPDVVRLNLAREKGTSRGSEVKLRGVSPRLPLTHGARQWY